MKTQIAIFWLVFLPVAPALAQRPIELRNPSFETDKPEPGKTPSGWINLGAKDQTPPDIQPGFFGVSQPAQDGNNYLALVVRESNTWEGVGQELTDYLKKDSAYSFSIWLSRSNELSSGVLGGNETILKSFDAPTILKIWGYNTSTRQEELLAESQPVSHSKWVKYEFVLKPIMADYDEIDLMAYYAYGFELKNGNLLIDNCSSIQKVH